MWNKFKVSFSELKGPLMLDGNDGNDLTPEYYSHFEVVVHYTRFHFMTLLCRKISIWYVLCTYKQKTSQDLDFWLNSIPFWCKNHFCSFELHISYKVAMHTKPLLLMINFFFVLTCTVARETLKIRIFTFGQPKFTSRHSHFDIRQSYVRWAAAVAERKIFAHRRCVGL